MSNNLTIQEPQTVGEVVAQKRLMQEVMKAVMKPGVHYGTIPGCGDKPSLFKPGADCILSTFKIAAMPEIEDLSTEDEAKFRVLVKGVHITSGHTIGIGIGECSSNEEKYKWRKAYDDEWDATPEDRRRVKFGKWKTKQVRTNPADVANTVLKMAKKRGQVDLTLTATGASDIFSQDLEDLPEGIRENVSEVAPLQEPRRVKPVEAVVEKEASAPLASGGNFISEKQRKRFFAMWKSGSRSELEVKAYLKEHFKTESTSEIPKGAGYNKICEWVEANAEPVEEAEVYDADEEIPFA